MKIEASKLISAQRRLGAYFDADLFADPARDILLDLYAAEQAGRKLSITSCCIAANVPASTAMRWLAMLEERGYILRAPDPGDRRRVNLRLSTAASVAIGGYLEDAARILAGRALADGGAGVS